VIYLVSVLCFQVPDEPHTTTPPVYRDIYSPTELLNEREHSSSSLPTHSSSQDELNIQGSVLSIPDFDCRPLSPDPLTAYQQEVDAAQSPPSFHLEQSDEISLAVSNPSASEFSIETGASELDDREEDVAMSHASITAAGDYCTVGLYLY